MSVRLLADMFDGPGTLRPYVLHHESPSRGAVTLAILPDPTLGHTRLARADDEIVQRLVELSDLTDQRIRLLTFDNGMSFRARLAGLDVARLVAPTEGDSAQRSSRTGTERRS